MNIWFFNHYAVPPSLYPLARTYNFSKFLAQKGHFVKIFAASTVHNSDINLIEGKKKFKEQTVDNIDHVFVKTNNYKTNGFDRIVNMIQYATGLFKVTKKFDKPDVIVASSVHPLTCVAGILLAKKKKCPCIIEIADLWPQTLIDFGKISNDGIIAKSLYRLERWIYKRANFVVFTMEGGKDYIVEKHNDAGIDLSKIMYLNNGVDLDKFNFDMMNYEFVDDHLDSDNVFKVVYTGSLGEANAANYIIEAAKIIQDKGLNNIKILIFGSGTQKKELENMCFKYNLNNIIFKGKVDKKYIPNILSKSSLNIFTGRDLKIYKYGISLNKMFDYFASGKPTISNIQCGYDNIKKYHCGLTISSESSEALAEGIEEFYLMQQDLYDQYCSNALRAAKAFDFRVLTEKLEELIIESHNQYIK